MEWWESGKTGECSKLRAEFYYTEKSLNKGCLSAFTSLPVSTALIKLSGFAVDFVKQSDKQSSDTTCAKSSIEPENYSCRS